MAAVLVVDDDEDLLPVLRDALTSEGWKVLDAPSGSVALKTAQRFPVDVVLSDLRMPGLDGQSLEAAFKGDPRLELVPFVFMTADLGQLRETHVARMLVKPFLIDDMLAILKNCLPRETRDSLSGGAGDQRL